MPDFGPADFERALARLPQWILLLGAAGTAIAGIFFGLASGGGFLMGSLAAYVNYRAIERVVNRLAKDTRSRGLSATALLSFGVLIAGTFVILRYSGLNMTAAFWGFLACPAALVLEILYEAVTYDS